MSAITKIHKMATNMANNMKTDQIWPPKVPSASTTDLSFLSFLMFGSVCPHVSLF